MHSKKHFILLLAAFGVLIGIPLFLLALSPKQSNQIPVPTLGPTPTLLIPVTQTPEGKLEINGVEVNNFLKDPVSVDSEKDVFFIEKPGYQIAYLSQFNKFLISITSSPFLTLKTQAEEDFVKTLGVTEPEACQLDVEVSTPQFANPEYAGAIYPLSFCQNQ